MSRLCFAAFAALALVSLGCTSSGRSGPSASCSPACSGFQMCCPSTTGSGNTCASTSADPMNCGGCGVRCGAGESCRTGACTRSDGGVVPPTDGAPPRVDSGGGGGMCTPTCSSTQRCCGTACINRGVAAGMDGRADPSFMNCNGCGLACNEMTANACTTALGMPSGSVSCRCGNFPACVSGAVCATGATGTQQCVNLMTDPSNCGMIGHACGSGETCSAGTCICPGTGSACAAGQGCCGGRCVDTSADAMNCGMCGRSCPGDTTCSAGRCLCGTEECAAPAGGSLGQLCCAGHCVAQDNSNCGMCGSMCDPTASESCIEGMSITGGSSICCGISFGGMGICLDFGGGLDAGIPIP